MVIFLPVLAKKMKNKTEIIKNKRAMAKGEKSSILMGQISATIPKTSVADTITEPIKLPKIIFVLPRLAEAIAK